MQIGDVVYRRDMRAGTATLLGAVSYCSNGYNVATYTDGYRVPGEFVWVGNAGPFKATDVCSESQAVWIGLEIIN